MLDVPLHGATMERWTTNMHMYMHGEVVFVNVTEDRLFFICDVFYNPVRLITDYRQQRPCICVSDGLVLTFGPPYLLFLIPLSPVPIHREERGKRISIVLDMSNAGLSNVDIPFISFLVNLFKFYYPDMLNSIIVFEMPWIMNGKLAVTCLHITYFNFFTRTILLLL